LATFVNLVKCWCHNLG